MLFLDKLADVLERKEFTLRRGAMQEYLHTLGAPLKQLPICQQCSPIGSDLQRLPAIRPPVSPNWHFHFEPNVNEYTSMLRTTFRDLTPVSKHANSALCTIPRTLNQTSPTQTNSHASSPHSCSLPPPPQSARRRAIRQHIRANVLRARPPAATPSAAPERAFRLGLVPKDISRRYAISYLPAAPF